MAKTLSTMLPLGTSAPEFSLMDIDGKIKKLQDFADAKAYLIMFICNHCPYVIHVRETLVKVTEEFQAKGVAVIAINSNDPQEYPEDSPTQMKALAQQYHFRFPYLFDESQAVAKAYRAACTPDFFVFDRKRLLVYRGQMDESRPGNAKPNDARDLRSALIHALEQKPISPEQKPSMGCNIKWRSGNEPSYY